MSNGSQKSVELGESGHGAFTHFLVEGRRGGADTDGDGVVTADELWVCLNGKVRDAARRLRTALRRLALRRPRRRRR